MIYDLLIVLSSLPMKIVTLTSLRVYFMIIASAMVIYVSTLPWIPALLLKTKGCKEIFSSEPEPKFPTGANSDILGVTKSNSPQRCTSGSAFNLCVLQNRPQATEMRDYSGYRKSRIKT